MIENPEDREHVSAAMQQLQASTQVAIAVITVFEHDVYSTGSRAQSAQWLAQQQLGITIFLTAANHTKAFQKCELQVSPAVETLLSAQDRQQIQTDLMEYYFHSTPVPSDAYTAGLVAGIEAMQKRILEPEEPVPKAIQYQRPLTAYIDDNYALTDSTKLTFADGDTIQLEDYSTGITLYVEDATGKQVELSANNFPDIQGKVWYPGFTINIEELKDSKVKAFRVLIPEMDTLQLYVIKSPSELEIDSEGILALLSAIHTASENSDEAFDLSKHIATNSNKATGSLTNSKVNGKYEVQQLQLKLSDADIISLNDVEVEFREGIEKDQEVAVLKFKAIEDNKPILEITVEKKDHLFIDWYLLGKKPVFKITTTHIESSDHVTISSFVINTGSFSGYFLERPPGTAVQERTSGSYKRIPENTYRMCYTYKSCRSETTRNNADNETWIRTNGVLDANGAVITREYVLIHTGNYPWHSAGCLLIGSSYQNYTLAKDYDDEDSGTLFEEGLTIRMVTDSGGKLTALNNKYKELIDITKEFDNECETNKCYEMEIEINR